LQTHRPRLSPCADIDKGDSKLITSLAATPIEHHFTDPGRHRLLALDARGAYDAVEVRVLRR